MGLSPRHLSVLNKAEGVLVLEDIEAVAVGAGETSAADRAYAAILAGPAALAVSPCLVRIIDLSDVLAKDIADGRGEFTAGMNLTIGQKGHKIKRCAATVACAAPEEGHALVLVNDVDEVVLYAHDGIRARRIEIGPEK